MIESPDDVVDLANGFMAPRALLAGARTGLFGALAQGPRTASELAQTLSLDARAASLLAHALAALGLLVREADEPRDRAAPATDRPVGREPAPPLADPTFSLAPVARECLVPGSPRDLTDYLALDAHTFESWSRLETALATGRPVEISSQTAALGATDRHRAFIRGMRSTALGNAPIVAKRLDLDALLGRAPVTLLDLGGGPGTYALEWTRRRRGLTATVVDLAETLAIARELLADEPDRDAAARILLRAGDFHRDDLGGPYDVAWVSHVIHGHPEPTLVPLLGKVRAALAPGGLVALHDFFLDDDRTRPAFAALFGVNMLVMSDRGRTYSASEARALLEAAGFSDVRRHDLGERRGIGVVTARLMG